MTELEQRAVQAGLRVLTCIFYVVKLNKITVTDFSVNASKWAVFGNLRIMNFNSLNVCIFLYCTVVFGNY